MPRYLAEIAVSGCLAVVGLGLVTVWRTTVGGDGLTLRRPGQDHAPSVGAGSGQLPVGKLTNGPGQPSPLPGSWPRFRGENFDGIAKVAAPLARSWSDGGPPVLWSIEVGEGYAAAAVRAGRVYLVDYDREASADAIRCLSLDDGREIWRFSYPNAVKRNHGMSRTIPAVTDKHLVALGPQCHVTCLDAVQGVPPDTKKPYWMVDLVAKYGATVPPWYAGQCPLVENGRVILAPAGPEVLMVALDLAPGNGEVKEAWKCPNPRGWKMTHSSILPMEVAGRRMYVYCASGGVAGVAADDGSLLWDTTDWKISIATCPSPLVLPEGRLFCSGGYNSGAVMLQVSKEGDRFVAKTLFRLKPDRFGSTQQTPVFSGGFIYGVREKDKELVCLNLEGGEVWSSGSGHRFGLGPYLIAEGLLYAMDDTGRLTLAEAVPDGFKPLGQAQVLQGHDAWGPMAMAEGRLIVRDFTRMICVDVAQHNPPPAAEK